MDGLHLETGLAGALGSANSFLFVLTLTVLCSKETTKFNPDSPVFQGDEVFLVFPKEILLFKENDVPGVAIFFLLK